MRPASIRLACAALLAFAGQAICALAADPIGPSHGIAMHGEPALPADFTHLPYANPDAPKGGRLSIGFQGTFDSLNPFNLKAGSTAQGLNTNVFQTLMVRSLDEPFTLYGLIAQSIETDEAREHVTFRIDPRARFSDGTPITAEDVVFTFELLKTKGRPQQRSAYGQVKKIEARDARTIAYDLSGADDRELPLTLALMPVLSKKHTDAERFAETSLDIPVASGPYRIESIRPGELLILKRNPDYWAKDLPIHRGLFNFDEIRIEYFRDAAALYEAFKGGLVDYREETNPTRWLTGYDFPAMKNGKLAKASLALGVPKGMTGFAFNTATNKFTSQVTGDLMVRAHAALKCAAVSLFKIANDMRWLGSGPRTGLMEMTFPSNEPGSSIMPGKVNPTQAEAMLMVCIQIMGSDVAVQMGGSEGNFELNAFRPVLISNYLHSALIMADMCDHFREFMIEGAVVNEAQLKSNIDRSVMMVTALSPVIGYDKASEIAHYAIDNNTTLKQAALAKGVDEAVFDRVVVPINMTRPGSADVPAAKA